MSEVAIELPSPLVLYDPTEQNPFGLSGESEAKALAAARGIPEENVRPLPSTGNAGWLGGVRHDGHLIVISHGKHATGYATMRTRKNVDATGSQFKDLLVEAGLDLDSVRKIELIVCKAASGAETFARQLYVAVNQGGRSEPVRVKAPVGFAPIDAAGGVSVCYFHFADPDFGFGSTMWSMFRGTLGSWTVGDWYVYPPGATF